MRRKHIIPTIREADVLAKKHGLVRGYGKHNGFPYWVNRHGFRFSRDSLAELVGYKP